MRSIAPPDSAVQSSGTIPPWRALLHARGLSDATIDHFAIQPDRTGWLYPVAPDAPVRRWKAFPRHNGAKYRWKPKLPPDARFYDPHGDLDQRVTERGGALILAAGEPDVWALHEAGIFHATATMHGEGTIPAWFVAELQRLGVTRVLVWPDRDQTGVVSALKLRQALAGTGIALDLYALPGALGSKADINATLLDVGAAALWDTLRACPLLDLPEVEPEPTARLVPPTRNVPDDAASLYERWCVEVVEAEAVRAWQIAPPNAKHLSRKNFHSPYREDRNPSAQWNYDKHGFTDYATGEFTNTKTVADLLGLAPWDAYRAAQRAPLLRPSLDALAAAAPRVWCAGVPQTLISFLLNFHGDRWLNVQRGVLPNLGAAAVTYAVWHELVAEGTLDEREPVTAAKLARLSAHGRQLSKDTAGSGLKLLAAWQLIEFLSLSNNDSAEIGTETRLMAEQHGSPGRKGDQYRLRSLDAALRDFLAQLEPVLLSVVLVRDHPDLPVSAQALQQPLRAYGLSDEHLRAIDAASAPLYDAHRVQKEKAAAEFRRRRGIFRAKYGMSALLGAAPLVLPMNTPTPNAAAFRDAVDEVNLAAAGGVRTDRYDAARRVGRGMGSHRDSCARRGIATIPQYEEHLLCEGVEVLAQCEALDARAYRRGAMELVAPNRSSVRVSAQHAGQFDYDGWVAESDGEAPVTVRIQRPSIEKRRAQATEAEVAAAEAISAKQQTTSRRRWQAEPGKSVSRVKSIWPADYLLRQGELRAEACGVRALVDGRFLTPDGEVLPRDPASLWRGLAAAMLPGPLAERPPKVADPHHYANQARPCVLCGEAGAHLHWTGWYCAEHAALPLDEKLRRRANGQGNEEQPPEAPLTL